MTNNNDLRELKSKADDILTCYRHGEGEDRSEARLRLLALFESEVQRAREEGYEKGKADMLKDALVMKLLDGVLPKRS